MPALLLQRYVDYWADHDPAREAVTDGLNSLTYSHLARRSNQLARCLIHNGVSRGGHVILFMNRSAQYVAAIMGVLKADAVYVPLEARTPLHRLNQIVRDCRPQALICDAHTVQTILETQRSVNPVPVTVSLDSVDAPQPIVAAERIDSFDPGPLRYENDDDDLASVIYTSGSTGNPKGVMITHRNIDAYIDWAIERIGISQDDRLLSTAPFHFDMSLFDLYAGLRAGATICIATGPSLLFPSKLIDFAEAQRVTIWKGISSLLMYLARSNAISSHRLAALKTILFSGESLHAKYLIEWMNTFPEKTFYNAYGPTEATGISMYYRVHQKPASPEERIPIGRPCENTEVFLVDECNRPVSKGDIGELCIKGICLTKGYLNDPTKTNQVFIDNPMNPGKGERVYKTGDLARLRPDGNYEFFGRKDDQIKFLGYRIELSDIERALISIDGVRDAGVILAESATADLEELVAYTESDNHLSPALILRQLKTLLPHYMIPRHLYSIEKLPRSSRGKVDRRALMAYHAERLHLQ